MQHQKMTEEQIGCMNSCQLQDSNQLDEVITLVRQGKWAETVGLLDQLAEEGHPAAQYWLAMRYRFGRRFPNTDPNSRKRFVVIRSDMSKTVELMRQSAEKGYAPALHWMSVSYHIGHWVEQDNDRCFDCARRGAEQGHVPSIFQLSECYRFGWGTEKDFEQSVRLCVDAAEKGHPMAEYVLSSYYAKGKDVEHHTLNPVAPDMKKAVMWCERAANHDNIIAQYQMGHYYLNGLGVEKDLNMARIWLKKAIHLKNAAELLKQMIHDYYKERHDFLNELINNEPISESSNYTRFKTSEEKYKAIVDYFIMLVNEEHLYEFTPYMLEQFKNALLELKKIVINKNSSDLRNVRISYSEGCKSLKYITKTSIII